MEYKTGCLICGKELSYLENAGKRGYYYCLEKYDTNVACTDWHFVCDKCHSLPANEFIELT